MVGVAGRRCMLSGPAAEVLDDWERKRLGTCTEVQVGRPWYLPDSRAATTDDAEKGKPNQTENDQGGVCHWVVSGPTRIIADEIPQRVVATKQTQKDSLCFHLATRTCRRNIGWLWCMPSLSGNRPSPILRKSWLGNTAVQKKNMAFAGIGHATEG